MRGGNKRKIKIKRKVKEKISLRRSCSPVRFYGEKAEETGKRRRRRRIIIIATTKTTTKKRFVFTAGFETRS